MGRECGIPAGNDGECRDNHKRQSRDAGCDDGGAGRDGYVYGQSDGTENGRNGNRVFADAAGRRDVVRRNEGSADPGKETGIGGNQPDCSPSGYYAGKSIHDRNNRNEHR